MDLPNIHAEIARRVRALLGVARSTSALAHGPPHHPSGSGKIRSKLRWGPKGRDGPTDAKCDHFGDLVCFSFEPPLNYWEPQNPLRTRIWSVYPSFLFSGKSGVSGAVPQPRCCSLLSFFPSLFVCPAACLGPSSQHHSDSCSFMHSQRSSHPTRLFSWSASR